MNEKATLKSALVLEKRAEKITDVRPINHTAVTLFLVVTNVATTRLLDRRGEKMVLKSALKAALGQSPAKPVKRGEQNAAWYDDSFDRNAHWREHYTKSRYHFAWAVIADRLARRGTASVLDIGCGSGQLAQLLADKGINRYVGVDFSEKRIAHAKRVCPQFEFRCEDAFASDAFDGDYDGLVTTEFLEHVERDLDAIDRVKPSVYFIGTVPNFPFESHVRHFNSEDEVTDRYSKYFTDFRVDSFYGNDKGQTFFLLEGIKR